MATSRKSGGKPSEDFKQEELLQAVVMADSFNIRFVPLTNSRPRTLLPMVNVPLLEYTLEFLSAAGVQRTIVFCCSHAEQIKQHIQQSKWSKNGVNKMEVTTVVSEGCLSLGDALRDLEAKSIIRTDFVLVHGDMVSNLNVAKMVDEHRRRRQSVKGAVMTMIYKKALPGHRTRSVEDEMVVVVQSQTKRIVGHQRLGTDCKKFVLHRESFESHRSVEIHHDLLDCHIAICSPLVLQMMADNFDFETVDDLIRGILVNEEVLDMSVYSHIIDGAEYAACVSDPTVYQSISENVMSRWAYPHVPDQNTSGLMTDSHAYCRHNVYMQQDVVLHRGSSLIRNVAVGHDTVIGENSVLLRCAVGKKCTIGKNVCITDSCIFDNVVIGDCCNLVKVMVDSNCVINDKCVITESVLGTGTVLASETTVPPGTRLAVDDQHIVDGFNIVPFDNDTSLFVYVAENEALKLYYSNESRLDADDLNETFSSSDSEEENGEAQPVSEEKLITEELTSTLVRVTEENISTENAIVEINSIKHAYGIEIKLLNGHLVKTLLALPLRNTANSQTPNSSHYFVQFKAIVKRFHMLLKNYFRTRESQTDLLVALEDFAQGCDVVLVLLPKIVHHLYDELDVLSEPVILDWWKDMELSNRSSTVRNSLNKFIEWLKTADEEEDDDDE